MDNNQQQVTEKSNYECDESLQPPRNLFLLHNMPLIFFTHGVSLRLCVSDICRQIVTLFTCNINVSSYLSNVTFLRATVAFSTAEYVPGSSHSCYNIREACMIKTIHIALITLIQYVRPLLLLINVWHVKYEQEISNQNKLLSPSS